MECEQAERPAEDGESCERPATPIPADTRDIFGSTYTIGDRSLLLPELPGTITETSDGIEFQLTDGLVLRIAWAANPEAKRCRSGSP
jgi:hypothetical protein